jgi:hypothetical protein
MKHLYVDKYSFVAIATAHYSHTIECQTSHTIRMAMQGAQTFTRLDVPQSHFVIIAARDKTS